MLHFQHVLQGVISILFALSETQYFNCSTSHNCQNTLIECSSNTNNCIVECLGNRACSATQIVCSANKYCNITCKGSSVCESAIIIGEIGTKLFITASGWDALSAAEIHCPPDTIRGLKYLNDSVCNIYISDYLLWTLLETKIYAMEGFNNVVLTADWDSYYYDENYHEYIPYDQEQWPHLYCTDSLNESCLIRKRKTDPSFDFLRSECICNGYQFPTAIPTAEPTTLVPSRIPTFSPTKYNPNEVSPHTLYVSNNGSDTGICDPWPTDEISTVALFPSSSDCNASNTVTISSPGTHSHSVSANVYDGHSYDNGVSVLCFSIAESFICYNPTVVDVNYETIDYAEGYQSSQDLNIAYQTYQNYINNDPCWGGLTGQCGVFRTCPTTSQQLDGLWTESNGPYTFYILNGWRVGRYALCGNNSMNVAVSVSCSIYTIPCKTLDYALFCLDGHGICDKYDGNGKIQLHKGRYTFTGVIYSRNKQIRIEGMGYNKTVLYQNSHTNPLLVCNFRQCHLKLSNLSYYVSSNSSTNIIKAQNYGNVHFEAVKFVNSNANDTLNFIFEHYCHINFTDCIFTQQKFEWIITDNAVVSFTNCVFINISTDSIFVIKNATLLISQSVFAENNNLYSMITSTDQSYVSISNSTFTNNINNTYIWYSFQSKSSLINSPIDSSNNCAAHRCFACFDSDLFIDEISSSQQTIHFGHKNNSTAFNSLFAFNFNIETILNKVSFVNFGKDNGSIVFMPCHRFQSDEIISTTFNDISYSLPVPTHIFNQSGSFYQRTLVCHNISLCHIECSTEILTCFGSHFVSNNTAKALYKCSSTAACQDAIIDISATQIAAIECDGQSSCKQTTINVMNADNITMECISPGSCLAAEINIANVTNSIIKCYGVQSCNGLRVKSDSNNIQIFLHSFNKDIIIVIPSEFKHETLHCNEKHSFLSVDGDTFIDLKTSAMELFGGGLPCEAVVYQFSSADKPMCEIRYQIFSNEIIDQKLSFLTETMKCYSEIYISEISSYECVGTGAPTLDPTIKPTNDPTVDPTGVPTSDPTLNPSKSPTPSPTRYPTKRNEYNKFFMIKYLIKYLRTDHIDILLADVGKVTEQIIDIIEKSYTKATDLPLRFFWLQIESIADMRINDISPDSKPHFIEAANTNGIYIKGTIKCGDTSCGILLNANNNTIKQFEALTQKELRYYFGQIAESEQNQLIQFYIERMDSVQNIHKSQLSVWDIMSLNYALVTSFAVVIFGGLFSLFSLLHNKQKWCLCKDNAMDDAIWVAILLYSLQMIDFFSDINLSTEMIASDNFTSNTVIQICSVASITFIIIPYLVNLYFAITIKTRIPSSNDMAISYFNSYSLIFVALMILCGGCYPSLTMVSSAVFGLKHLNCGITAYELKQMSQIKIIGTIWLENVPQLLIQVAYANTIGNISTATAFSFVASALSILATVTSYCIEKKDTNLVPITYNIIIRKTVNDLNECDKNKFAVAKGKTEQISKYLSPHFGCNYKNIEVSRNALVCADQITFYIVHHINKDLKPFAVPKMYHHKQALIMNDLRTLFNIGTEFNFEYSEISQTLLSSANSDRDELDVIVNRLRRTDTLFLRQYVDDIYFGTPTGENTENRELMANAKGVTETEKLIMTDINIGSNCKEENELGVVNINNQAGEFEVEMHMFNAIQ